MMPFAANRRTAPARELVRALVTFALVLLVATPLVAQRKGKKGTDWRTDPYTQNDRAAIERAGYVSLGPFTLGDRHDTKRVEQGLGRVKIRWVETEHLKIGSSLPEMPIPRDKKKRAKVRAELAKLAEKLPNLKPRKVKKLDPWLRLHLYAQRLEDHYVELRGILGRTDDDFPSAQGELKDGKFMGRGPYFGMRSKFLVIMLEKDSSWGRYLTTFCKRPDDAGPTRHYFLEEDAFLVGTNIEFAEATFTDDTALHSHLVFNQTQNLLDGYRAYQYQIPAWWKEGLAHWFARRVTEERNNFTHVVKASERTWGNTEWKPQVYKRVKHDLVRPLREVMASIDLKDWTIGDHQACWSRIEFLLTQKPRERFGVFADVAKSIVVTTEKPTQEQLVARMLEAMKEAWDLDPDRLDAEWKEWVRKTYPKK